MSNAQAESFLAEYRVAHGRTWKRQLWNAWMSGRYRSDDNAGALQLIRNQFGPAWLTRIKIPLPLYTRSVQPNWTTTNPRQREKEEEDDVKTASLGILD